MSNVEKLSIAITPKMASEVRAAVKNGEYASSSEIIREALRDWRRKRLFQEQEINELRDAWSKGINSEPGQYESIGEIKKAARDQLSENN